MVSLYLCHASKREGETIADEGDENRCEREAVTDDEGDGVNDQLRLHVIVTPELDAPATEVVERYRARQSKQENAIRDWWLPLGGDVNVVYDERPIENSELAGEKEKLEARLGRLELSIPACEERLERAQQRHQKYIERCCAELEVTEKKIEKEIQWREARGEAALDIYRWAEAEKDRARRHLEPARRRVDAILEKIEKEEEKQQRYREERQKKQRALAEVTQAMKEHPIYELDERKDQMMSALRVFLVNVLQWLRGTVFPESYARATYETLATFLQMGSFVVERRDCIKVFLDGFWQSAKQRELREIVARCNAQRFTAPDGRALRFGICPRPGYV